MPWRLLTGPPTEEESRVIRALIAHRSKFLVDESLGVEVANVLKGLRYNVKFGPDVGLGGKSDQDVYAYSWRHKRILLTHDRDFLNDREFPFHRNPGVIVLPGAEGEEVPLVRALGQMLRIFGTQGDTFPNAKILIDGDLIWHVQSCHKADGYIERYKLRFTKQNVYRWY